jgi:hypothetical protein
MRKKVEHAERATLTRTTPRGQAGTHHAEGLDVWNAPFLREEVVHELLRSRVLRGTEHLLADAHPVSELALLPPGRGGGLQQRLIFYVDGVLELPLGSGYGRNIVPLDERSHHLLVLPADRDEDCHAAFAFRVGAVVEKIADKRAMPGVYCTGESVAVIRINVGSEVAEEVAEEREWRVVRVPWRVGERAGRYGLEDPSWEVCASVLWSKQLVTEKNVQDVGSARREPKSTSEDSRIRFPVRASSEYILYAQSIGRIGEDRS